MVPHEPDQQNINWSPIIVIILGSFMAFLNASIVNVAIPKMMLVFGASQDSIQWVLTAYMLALGIIMPISGYLGDTFGYKRVFIISLSLFILGSIICGMAWSVNSLIAARILQALGGGVMQPLSMALIFKLVPREKIGMVLGVWGISAMAAPAIGPTLGGYLVDLSWRTIFYINVPIGVFNFFLAVKNLEETKLIKGKSFDKWGVVLSSTGLFCLLMALSKGSSKGWTSLYIIGLFIIAAATLTSFIRVELRHPEPILELRLFKNFLFTLSLVITSIVSIGFFGAIFLMPIYIQNVLGMPAMKSGMITFPAALLSGIMMPVAGRIFDKHGARLISIIGLTIVVVTTFMMHTFNLMTPVLVIVAWLSFRGIGMGLSNMPVATAGMNTVPIHLIGRASAMNNVIRQIAASFGIAMFTTVLQHRQVLHFAELAQNINLDAQSASALNTMQTIAASNGISVPAMQTITLSIINQNISLQAAAMAIGDCFLLAAVLCLTALILCFFLQDKKDDADARL